MKKTIFIFIVFIIVHCTFIIEDCICQWEPDVRLTTGSGTSYSSLHYVAAYNNIVHVVWYDNRDGNWEIYYKQSTNHGINWGAGTRLTNNSAVSEYPGIAVSGSIVHIVWVDDRDGNDEIYYKRSSDGGINWGTDTRLTAQSNNSGEPSISVSGSIVHLVWIDDRDGNDEIYYKRSTDGGIGWGTDTRLTIQSDIKLILSIAVFGSNVHIAWQDHRDINGEIYYKQSTNNGINWGSDIGLTNNSANSYAPSIAVSGSNVNVVWYDNRDGNFEIYNKHSTNNGINWGTDTRLTNNIAISGLPSIALSGSVVHIVWEDEQDGNYEIYYKQSTNNGINWGSDIRLTNNSACSSHPSIAISGSIVHVVWTDDRNGNDCIYYKRNPTGNSIGIKNISSEVPEEFALEQNYPNPFNSMTNVKFQMLNTGNAKIIVYDLMGREVSTLVNEKLQAGTYEVRFDAGNLPSGIYFYQLKANNFIETKKLILIK